MHNYTKRGITLGGLISPTAVFQRKHDLVLESNRLLLFGGQLKLFSVVIFLVL